MPETNRDADLEILGQKFRLPDTPMKLLGLLAILVAIIFIAQSMITHRYGIKRDKDGLSLFTAEVTDKIDISRKFIIGFWTPSDNTGPSLQLRTARDSAKYLWQINEWQLQNNRHRSIDSLNKDFGEELKREFGFAGYRRTKVIGEGKTTLKEGWWWSIAFDGDCDEKFLKRFRQSYSHFWSPGAEDKKEWDNLHIEIIGSFKN